MSDTCSSQSLPTFTEVQRNAKVQGNAEKPLENRGKRSTTTDKCSLEVIFYVVVGCCY